MHQYHVNEDYLAFVRAKPCVRCGAPSPSDPHHLVSRGWREPTRNDYTAVPCCRHCHSLYEAVGWDVAKWLETRRLPSVYLAECVANLMAEFFTTRLKECGI
jgi:transposase